VDHSQDSGEMNVIGAGHADAATGVGELKVLLLEDAPADAELIERTLRQSGFVITTQRVETKETFSGALDEFAPDIVLADFKLPTFDGLSAVTLAHHKYPDLPIIVVTGALGDETAVELIKAGAVDYVLKDRLARLPTAVGRAMAEAAKTIQLRQQIAAVRVAEARLHAVAIHAHDAIVIIDDEGLITFWNKAAERLFGFSGDEVMGLYLHRLVGEESDLPFVRKGLAEFAKTGKGPIVGRTRELTARRKDGGSVRVELAISAIQFEGKWSAMGVVRDVNERPQLVHF
jgi:PAS domain S-box-containing protein